MKRSLTGVKPTGMPHLGNYLGAIKPAIELQKTFDTYYFVANWHALTSSRNREEVLSDTYEVAATFIASGLDPQHGAFYRQSDLPEITELAWYLSCTVSMGDLFRAHTYKAAKDKGEEGAMNHGTFSYPVLMAADILIMDADVVPVGKDQAQHLEMSRAIAQRLNHYYGDTLKEPKELIREDVGTIIGLDGRKMSKSYNNGIYPFDTEKKFKSQVMSIVTDSKGLEDVKDPTDCTIVKLYKLFATSDEVTQMEANYRKGGYGYGHAKQELFKKMLEHFGPMREKYQKIRQDTAFLDDVFNEGLKKAKPRAQDVVQRVRKTVGIQK